MIQWQDGARQHHDDRKQRAIAAVGVAVCWNLPLKRRVLFPFAAAKRLIGLQVSRFMMVTAGGVPSALFNHRRACAAGSSIALGQLTVCQPHMNSRPTSNADR